MDAMTLKAILTLDSSEYDKGLNKAEKEASGIGSKIGGAFGKVGSTIGGALKAGINAVVTGVTAATAAVTTFAGASVKTGMEFDTAMSQVAATMGKTMSEMDDEVGTATISVNGKVKEFSGTLREFAIEMGRNTAFSATEAAEALNYMALAGYDTQTSMSMLPNVLNLAAAGSFDLARASDMLTDTQTAFGISLERTNKLVDEMAKAASTGNTSVEQLGDAFLVVGGLAQELNGGMVTMNNGTRYATDGVQELEIALTAMANAGVKGSEAGTHMRNMLLKLSDPTKEGAEQLKNLGVDVFDKVSGNMRSLTDIFGDLSLKLNDLTQEERIQAISALFNTRDMASAKALLNAVTGEYVKFGDQILSVDEAYQQFGEDIYDSNKGFEVVKTSWDNIGESILNARYKIEDVDNAVKNSGVEWSKYSDTYWGKQKNAVENLTSQILFNLDKQGMSVAETAAFIADEYSMSFSDAQKAVEAAKQSMDEAQGSAQKMADTQLDNLEGDITRLKSAFEGAKILVSDQLTPTLREFVQFGTEGISKIADGFQEGGLTGAMAAFGEVLSDGLAMITGKLPEFVSAGVQLVGALGRGIMDNLSTIIDTGIEILAQLGNAIVKGLPAMVDAGLQIIESLLEAIAANINEIMEAGQTLIQGIIDAVNKHGDKILDLALFILETLVNSLIDNIPKIIKFVTEMITGLTEFISNNADKMVDSAIAMVEAIGQGLIENLPIILEAAIDMIIALAEALTDPTNLATLLDTGLEILMTVVEAIINNLPKLVEAALQIILNLVEFITENLDKVVEAAIEIIMAIAQALLENLPLLLSAAIDIVVALAGAIIENIPTVVKAILQVVEGIIKTLIASLPKMMENGAKIVESIIGGIVKLLGNVAEMALKLVSVFLDGIVGAGTRIFNTGKDMVIRLGDGIKNIINTAKEWGRDLIENFIGGIKDKINKVKETAEDIASSIKDILGFSEPEKGPLSDFHTYAPDMMNLFIKGVKDNTKKLQDQIADSFDFGNVIVGSTTKTSSSEWGSGSFEAAGTTNNNTPITINVYGAEGQDVRELADYVSDRILHMMHQTGAVYA